jgi:hypothetical protein
MIEQRITYINGRFVVVRLHKDCIEYRTRAWFCGHNWTHEAVVYTSGDAFMLIKVSALPGTDVNDRFEVEAFTDLADATRAALRWTSTAQGRRPA